MLEDSRYVKLNQIFMPRERYILVIIFSVISVSVWNTAFAQPQKIFFIEPQYDISNREEIEATLFSSTGKLYWYAEKDWLEQLSPATRDKVRFAIDDLSLEFERKIYPELTTFFGSEWNPGIDNDPKITILLHRMKKDARGYWTSKDEYSRFEVPNSNEREMVYLNADKILDPLAKSFLAHEFTHLIVFNQKERKLGMGEEVWLQELRAELASRLLGYDDNYKGSNLENRVKSFLSYPNDSLLNWKGEVSDYGVANLFMQYLVDHYGKDILIDSLKIPDTGIDSLNAILIEKGFDEDFSQIFTDWTIALVAADCSSEKKYCYLSPNLKNLKITPSVYFLPLSGESALSITIPADNWSANWYKFIGGHDTLKLEFKGPTDVKFKVPYILESAEGKLSFGMLSFNQESFEKLEIQDFGNKVVALTIIPTVQDATLGLDSSFSFSWTAFVSEEKPVVAAPISTPTTRETRIADLLLQIVEIQRKLSELRAKLAVLQGVATSIPCKRFERDLFYGMQGPEVRCLQEFLKAQGPEIYPEGLVTGNFLELTKAAVIRFQEKYAAEILASLGFAKGTGFVGPLTRAKINELLR